MNNNKYIKSQYGSLVGKTIKEVRALTADEANIFGWSVTHGTTPCIIIMTDGSVMIPSSDPEGNSAGHIFVEKVEPLVWLNGIDEAIENMIAQQSLGQ
jgi:hypothetical protein